MFHFTFIINRWANFYFFVQNLTSWHESNRINYNIFFQKQIDPFSQEIKMALENFRILHKKYPFGSHYLGHSFFLKKEPFKSLKKEILPGEYKVLEETFFLLEPFFNSLYQNELPALQKWKCILSIRANNYQMIKEISDSLSILYQVKPIVKNIQIFLLFSAPKESGGGANVNHKSITLEISGLDQKDIGQALGVLWHEMIHLQFEKKIFLTIFDRKIQKDTLNGFPLPLNEIIAALLFPRGVFGQKIFKTSFPDARYLPFSEEKTKQALQLMQKWLIYKKSLNSTYLQSLSRIFSE